MTPWKNPPLVMSGLALGTLSLGNLLATYFPLFGYLGLSASLFIYGILLAGIIRNPHEWSIYRFWMLKVTLIC
ncbi:hypothetical protein MGGS36055_02636 [Streptococcus dysgalactiae subsp. equisimilis]|nr:hypothetical protein MGGS36055_02636 [Streptococcus dysgalactiae subsp. equisimilis]